MFTRAAPAFDKLFMGNWSDAKMVQHTQNNQIHLWLVRLNKWTYPVCLLVISLLVSFSCFFFLFRTRVPHEILSLPSLCSSLSIYLLVPDTDFSSLYWLSSFPEAWFTTGIIFSSFSFSFLTIIRFFILLHKMKT